MTLDLSGQERLPHGGVVQIDVDERHPLIELAKALPWKALMDLVVADLKKTTPRGFWQLGPKMKVRVHLGAYLLQRIYNLTDRRIEYQIKDNAAFRLFCGHGIVEGWHAPDHTRVEKFRNRLSPETHRALANSIAQYAVTMGFADPREVDFDSTVQEANAAYPSDANLMCKLVGLGKKLVDFLREKSDKILPEDLSVDFRQIKKKAREYFFLAKNKSIEVRREVFRNLHKAVKSGLRPIVKLCETLPPAQVPSMPWNIKRAFELMKSDAWRYLLDVAQFTRTHTIKPDKLLSFHARDMACLKKGKIGKPFEFGRVFQLGRIKGNFLFVLESTDILMNDKLSFNSLVENHMELFGEGKMESVATDKGYWSGKNRAVLSSLKLKTEGLQRPSTIEKGADWDSVLEEHLRNRRAGIEPLIGHIKRGGQLGRSRMKSDQGTLAAGYGSVLGMNLRQLIRHQQGKVKLAG